MKFSKREIFSSSKMRKKVYIFPKNIPIYYLKNVRVRQFTAIYDMKFSGITDKFTSFEK